MGLQSGSFHLDKKSLGLGQIVLLTWRLNGLKFTNPNSIFAWWKFTLFLHRNDLQANEDFPPRATLHAFHLLTMCLVGPEVSTKQLSRDSLGWQRIRSQFSQSPHRLWEIPQQLRCGLPCVYISKSTLGYPVSQILTCMDFTSRLPWPQASQPESGQLEALGGVERAVREWGWIGIPQLLPGHIPAWTLPPFHRSEALPGGSLCHTLSLPIRAYKW